MRLTRVFVEMPLSVGARVALPEAATGHLTRVLRLRMGDACVLFSGDGRDYDARVVQLDKRGAMVEVTTSREITNESALRITLLQGVARGEKMDLILQKGTELGIHAFVPVWSERSEVRLDGDRLLKRHAHWRGVVRAACEQSGRAFVPEVFAPCALQDVSTATLPALRCLLDPDAAAGFEQFEGEDTSAFALAVGPEGGWSPRDRSVLNEAGFVGVRMGPRILRTETAGLAAMAALQSRYGDLR